MNRATVLILGIIAFGLGGAATSSRPATTTAPATTQAVRDSYTFKGKYRKMLGPFISRGGGEAALITDVFDLTENVEGMLPVTAISVQPLTPKNAGYPSGLVEGKVYLLRLTPTAATRDRLVAMKSGPDSSIQVTGREVEEVRAEPRP